MYSIIKNTVIAFGVLVFVTACDVNVTSTTAVQPDRNYIVEDTVSTVDLAQSEQGTGGAVLPELITGSEGTKVMSVEAGGLASVKEDQSVILLDLLAGTSGVSGSTFSIVKVDNGNFGGVVQLLDNGGVQYTPQANFFGVEYFKYYVADESGELIVGTVIVEVEAVNDLPVVLGEEAVTQEDQSLVLSYLSLNDSDIDGDTLSVSSVLQSINGGLVELLDSGDVRYTPAADFFGLDSFVYMISDGSGAEVEAEVVVTVVGVNDTPIAMADSVVVTQNQESLFGLLDNDLGVGDGVQLLIISAPVNGNVVVTDAGIANYLPNVDYFGTDEFIYQVTDVDGDVSVATVSLQIECVANCTHTFNLSWDASISSDVSSYKVYVGAQSNALDKVIEVGNVLQFNHLVSTKGKYYFAVSAVNGSAVESELSSVQSAVF